MTEKKLFELLKEKYVPDLVMSRNQFSKWDCYSPSTKLRIELKCRRTHYDTLLIERKKYDALMYKATHNGDRPAYINSTPEGVYVFLLDEIKEPKWIIKSMPATTDFGRREWVKKEVGFLQISTAKKAKK
jgi:hypothetical protein